MPLILLLLLCLVPLSLKAAAIAPASGTPEAAAKASAAEVPVATTESPGRVGETGPAPSEQAPQQKAYIREFRVTGATKLTRLEIEKAVYPFMGPGRTNDDVEKARLALQKAYQDKGFLSVTVQIPDQQVRRGIVVLQVVEMKVGRLRVKGSRYYNLDEIKKRAPSMAEGALPNSNDITREIIALNQWPDRRVTPSLKAGVMPDTVDIDLEVKDTPPLHGNIELNNRYSVDTTELRLNAGISYNNLWQRGHSAGVSFQVAPQRPEDAKVFAGYYIARFPELSWVSFMVQGTHQDSNVSTLGGSASAGKGDVLGPRVLISLPPSKNFYQSLSVGFDYKHFDQDLLLGGNMTSAPITYWPITVNYIAGWTGKGRETNLNAGITFGLRGTGSNQTEWDNRRYNADGGFIYFRGSLSHSEDLPAGFQAWAQVQGQIANQPLVDSEEYSGGGLNTVRGYLESEVLGDNGIVGSFELRSPSLPKGWLKIDECRIYAFVEGGAFSLNDPLPEQTDYFEIASVGAGIRLRMLDHLNGSLDAGLPLVNANPTKRGHGLVTFRLWADF